MLGLILVGLYFFYLIFLGSYMCINVVSLSLSLSVLAAWFRLKYPHIALGALASSAPILQFDDITPWSSFYDAVSQDYKVCLIKIK